MGGFVSGVVKGGVLAVIGLAVLSEVLPPPQGRDAPSPDATAMPAEPAAPLSATPDAAAPDAAAPSGAEADADAAKATAKAETAAPSAAAAPDSGAPPTEPEGATPAASDPKAAAPEISAAGDKAAQPAPPAAEAPDPKGSEPEGSAAGDPAPQPATPAADAPAGVPAVAPSPDPAAKPAADAAAASAAPADRQAPAADPAASPAPEAATKAETPAPETSAPKAVAADPTAAPEPDPAAPDSAATQPAPDTGAPSAAPDAAEDAGDPPLPNELPATSPLAVAPPPAASAAPEPGAPTEPLLDRPKPGLAASVEGVTTGRLPTIDTAPEAKTAPEAPAAEAGLPEVDPAADAPPIVRYAAPFANPQGKPLYAVILIDDGSAGVDREALARLPLPITIALDPAQPDAAAHAALYRAAGKEIAMLASGLPKGAKPADIAVTFDANARALPETVAVIDLPKGGFQNDRPLSSDILPVIRDQGRGIVTFDVGLNAADQVARREGVPAAVVFRQLDAEGEGRGIIRRYLDRAAFKAAQDGRVTVLGTASPETLAALVEWSVEGRAGSVALAPLSAVLTTAN